MLHNLGFLRKFSTKRVPVALSQEVGLPFMRDSRHPEDQLFFVAEGDFRFYEEDCVGSFDWIQKLLEIDEQESLHFDEDIWTHPAFQGTSRAKAESFTRSRDTSAGPGSGVGGGRQGQPSFAGCPPGTRRRMREGHVSQELCDLVRIVTTASRNGLGNLVWLSWSGRERRKLHPCHGSSLIAITKFGAEFLQSLMNRYKAVRFDIWLRNVLLKDHSADLQAMGASFVVPSVGSFDHHLSGCDPTNAGEGGVRASTWRALWTQAGVRPTDRPGQQNERWICKFKKKGAADYVAKVDFKADRRLFWLTQAPPTKWWNYDRDWWRILESRGWVWNNRLAIPDGNDRARPGGGALRPSATLVVNGARWPDGYAWEDDVQAWSPITRMAELIVIDMECYDPLSHLTTERQKNTRKKQLALYKRRVFVYNEDDAA